MRDTMKYLRNICISLIIFILIYNSFINILFIFNREFKSNDKTFISTNTSSVFSPIGWNLNWSIFIDNISQWSLDVGSITNNSNNDIIAGMDNGNLSIFNDYKLNNSYLLDNTYQIEISLADLNFDSEKELIVVSGNNISVFEYNNGLSNSFLIGSNVSVFIIKDLKPESSDKLMEIIIGDNSGNVSIWQFNSNFSELSLLKSFIFTGEIISGIVSGDFTNNDKMDLAVITETGNLTFFHWHQQELIKLYSSLIFETSSSYEMMEFNINQDSKDEFVISDLNGNITIWEWQYGLRLIYTGIPSSSILSLNVKDLNNDGTGEILTGSRSGNVSIWGFYKGELKVISSIKVNNNVTGLSAGNIDENDIMEVIIGSRNNLSIYKLELADLRIENYNVAVDQIYRGESFSVTVNITNSGDFPAYNFTCGIYWDNTNFDYKLGASEIITYLNVNNSTQIIVEVPTDYRNTFTHTLIGRVNIYNSVLEKDISINQQRSQEVKVISFDWIWVLLMMIGILVVIVLGIFVFPTYVEKEDEEDEFKKTTVRKRKVKYKKKKR
ncbi:MAG: hypothetical protein GF329_16395 [Candidatus Lokiarchaeota archaeon]|nr:hypothetical protein [Candidatus Lokiarchaeota archaeon]